MTATTGLPLYDRTAERSSARLLQAYSTSFGLASRLFAPAVRARVADVYALVRIADEIVDGPAAEAGLDRDACREALDRLEEETERAIGLGYSANLVVHAFARTARATGIGTELTRPFFAAMRRDLSPIAFTRARELDEYVYGSAEVVGLMCLRCFSCGLPADDARDARWSLAARALGSAFQRVNFLRDIGEDALDRGRRYFPGVEPATFTDAQRDIILDDIDARLAQAAAVIPELPPSSRRAVAAAHAIYRELSAQLRRTPAQTIVARRVRVAAARKAALAASALLRRGQER